MLLTHQGRRRTSRGGRSASELTAARAVHKCPARHDELDRLLQAAWRE